MSVTIPKRAPQRTAAEWAAIIEHYQHSGMHQPSPSATAVTTNYLWCGETLCQARNAANTVLTTYYTQGQLNGSAPFYYARNHLGSVMNLIDGSGETVASYAYSPYGRTLAEKATSSQSADFRYAGMFYDTATGLYLTHYRAYSPEIRRWISGDPIGMEGGLNTYNYAYQNPLRYTDPAGLAVIDIPLPDLPFTLPEWITVPAGRMLGPIGLALSLSGDTPQQADQTRSESRSIPMPEKPKCGCTCICRADANDNIPENIKPGDKTFAFGQATASNCSEASKQAKRAATRALGKQPKHVGCRCNGR